MFVYVIKSFRTGFDYQQQRGNSATEQWANMVDPLMIQGEWRDIFPKIDLLGGHIGDGYPLCNDIPDKEFLRKGAKYRMLGSTPTLELMNLPADWIEFDPLMNPVILDHNSQLYNRLCNPNSFGGDDCVFETQTVLEDNLECFGQECQVDTLRLIQVTDGIYFEYVRQPCVDMSFYNDAQTITHPYRWNEMCGDPRLSIGGEMCCDGTEGWQRVEKNCEYARERVTFDTATQRCEESGHMLCYNHQYYFVGSDNDQYDEDCTRFKRYYHWHGTTCSIKAKVQDNTGKVSIVHETHIDDNSPDYVPLHVNLDNINYFPVYWSSGFPHLSNNCGNGICRTLTDGCLCNTSTEDSQVFFSAPKSVDEVISQLHIGSVSPDTYDDGVYQSPITVADVKIYLRNNLYDVNTIFEIQKDNRIMFYRNVKSVVQIVNQDGDAQNTFSFRNPPHFMSFSELDARDAYYETDAVLDHYMKHPNVPPFLAIHFIQRFGISNPSANYVETVAMAFKKGLYEYIDDSGSTLSFGDGQLGDLRATVAAVILDREARSILLDFDPSMGSLKEPLLKLISFMRSMEYEEFEAHRYQRYSTRLDDMTRKIGKLDMFIRVWVIMAIKI